MVGLNKTLNKLSSRSRRFGAYAIDSAILVFISLILGILARHTHNKTFLLVSYTLPALYFILFLISKWSATPGQRLLGIRVCDSASGNKISAVQSVFRFCVFEGMLALSLLVSIHSLATMVKSESQKSSAVYVSAKPTNSKHRSDDYIDSELLEQEHVNNDIGSMKVTVYEVGYLIGRDKHVAHEQPLLTNNSPISILAMVIYSTLLIVPTFMNNRRQTLYDMASSTCVVHTA